MTLQDRLRGNSLVATAACSVASLAISSGLNHSDSESASKIGVQQAIIIIGILTPHKRAGLSQEKNSSHSRALLVFQVE
jgi:hypothetical protein